jgi:pyruvate ferredoxin oxidoreductase beta subunit
VARLAKETGLFPVFEAEHGEVTHVSAIRRRVPVEDYLRLQGRYKHLFEPVRNADVIGALADEARRNIERFGLVTP